MAYPVLLTSRRAGLVILLALGILAPAYGRAEGPWRGQILDAGTKAPLPGVVVVAAWFVREASVGGWAGGGFYDSGEVVTGSDGRFEVAARSVAPPGPGATIRGPSWSFFKPGYGIARLAGRHNWPLYADDKVDEAWSRITTTGVLLELPPLATREERLKFLPTPPGGVPEERIPRFMEQLDVERVFLGLSPYGPAPRGSR